MKAPLAVILTAPPEASWITSPWPSRPETVPPSEYVVGGGAGAGTGSGGAATPPGLSPPPPPPQPARMSPISPPAARRVRWRSWTDTEVLPVLECVRAFIAKPTTTMRTDSCKRAALFIVARVSYWCNPGARGVRRDSARRRNDPYISTSCVKSLYEAMRPLTDQHQNGRRQLS